MPLDSRLKRNRAALASLAEITGIPATEFNSPLLHTDILLSTHRADDYYFVHLGIRYKGYSVLFNELYYDALSFVEGRGDSPHHTQHFFGLGPTSPIGARRRIEAGLRVVGIPAKITVQRGGSVIAFPPWPADLHFSTGNYTPIYNRYLRLHTTYPSPTATYYPDGRWRIYDLSDNKRNEGRIPPKGAPQ